MKTLVLTKVFLLLPVLLFAQSLKIKGVVLSASDHTRLSGVTILEKGTTNGTYTDSHGHFSLLTKKANTRLVISYIGYVTEEIKVVKEDSLIIRLKEDTKVLSEVVVVGYSTTHKKEVTGAVAVLSGRVAGLDIGVSTKSTDASGFSSTRVSDKVLSAKPQLSGGVLTAGELNDFSKWKLWSDITKNELSEWKRQWQINPVERYTAQLITEEGFPVVGATVFLKDRQGALIWEAKSDNTGKCELWNNLFSTSKTTKVHLLETIVDGQPYQIQQPRLFQEGINSIRIRQACTVPSIVDIAFVVDATGSMGDEIRYLQAELQDVMTRVKDSLVSSKVRLGSVFYRDHTDEYLTRKTNLSTDFNTTTRFIQDQRADGGGDFPEAVDEALKVAIEDLSWTEEATARLLFLILDAPPHGDSASIARIQQLTKKAAAKGIRIIPVTASGIDKSTEYLFRSIALASNGTYVFLTDDSGIGNAHIKPTTDHYEVELLNTLLVKLITKYTQVADCKAQSASLSRTTLNSKTDTLSGAYQSTSDSLTASTGHTPNTNTFKWKCFPNPTSDVLHVELEGDLKELFVTDMTGKILIRSVPVDQKVALSMRNFPSGVYFLKFFTGTKWEVSRFVVTQI
ncbi:carboxypeptidase-like regulatory domain-containing protein [Xanthocytophaga agilis]|uniref:Carboxypeptidase-like regulatory domain-containing protein n=1 Tax=Xanthocytophaga agilis TaxID=3048010 RepID=A0AAE3R433_9BACT|nr:carboxypeptidase-like regulatory domain-containing protein [Xanthocytophaga agilis]MDJ1501184.1 carboxypeptidase-like regulatory domain-containing protein [Xanthocytophaga agilis]